MSPSGEVEHTSLECSGDVQVPETLAVWVWLTNEQNSHCVISSSSSKFYKVRICGDCVISTKQLWWWLGLMKLLGRVFAFLS